MNVPFADLGRLHRSIQKELESAFDTVLEHSSFVGASTSREFEDAFANAHSSPYAAGCGSGTDALALALRASGVRPLDEVIVPAMTFVATAEAVVHVGAIPVIADVDPRTLLLSNASVEAVRTERTRAVIPVHLYGHVVPFDQLASWRASGLLVIEDAAQAHLASWEGRMVGSEGHVACFSFYPGKNLGALGDGGMVISRDENLVAEVRRLRDHGRRSKYEHDVIGSCSRLDGLQAAFLRAKLPHLPEWTENRRRLAIAYREGLTEIEAVTLVPWEQGAAHHLLVVRVAGSGRDVVQARLADAGIETGVHYPIPLSRQPSLAQWSGSCPIAEAAALTVLSLPFDPLMHDEEVQRVCEVLTKCVT